MKKNDNVEYASKNTINWYPGHMAKAKRLLAESFSMVDTVIELLDARVPISSQNPDIGVLFGAKPCLTLLTKSTLADDKRTPYFIRELEKTGRRVIEIDCKTGKNLNKITPAVLEMMNDKIEKDNLRGVNRTIRTMVVGVTNVGKSTFINTYTKTKKAKAEDRPGVTRSLQWITSPYGIDMLDTPGLLWHKFEDPAVGIKLAVTGAIRDEILDLYSLSHELIAILANEYPQLLTARFKIDLSEEDSIGDIFEKIARKRGFIQSGNQIDEMRTANILLDEFRGGLIGKITLD